MQKVSSLWESCHGSKRNVLSFASGLEWTINDNNPRATELILSGLLGCSGGSFLDVAEKMRIRIDGMRIDAEAERATEPPTVFTKILLTYHIDAAEELLPKVIRALQLGEQYCPVYNMMKKAVDIEVACYINGVKQDLAAGV